MMVWPALVVGQPETVPAGQVLWFVALFALVLALAYLTSRLVGGRALTRQRGRHLKVLESLPLGRDRALLLVECAGRVLLIGAGQSFSVLAAVRDPDQVATLLARQAPGPGARFQPLLQGLLRREGPGPRAGGGE